MPGGEPDDYVIFIEPHTPIGYALGQLWRRYRARRELNYTARVPWYYARLADGTLINPELSPVALGLCADDGKTYRIPVTLHESTTAAREDEAILKATGLEL